MVLPFLQSVGLREELSRHIAKHGDPLWVVSPLTRALQTFLLACPSVDRLPQPTAAAAGLGGPGGVRRLSGSSPGQATQQATERKPPLNVAVIRCVVQCCRRG